jgi:hypothetical protein
MSRCRRLLKAGTFLYASSAVSPRNSRRRGTARETSVRASTSSLFDPTPPIVKLNDPQKLDVSVKRFGREKNPILVVDDAIANAEEIREFALGLQFVRPLVGRAYYPGYQATCCLRGVSALGAWAAGVMWTKGFGLRAEDHNAMLNDVFSEPFFGLFSPSKTFKYGNVHADGHSWLALLVYLNPGEERYSGTSFWRHAPTGLESVCSSSDSFNLMTKLDAIFKTRLVEGSRKALETAPNLTYDDWISSLFRDEAELPPFTAHDHPPWENIGVVPAKFNRMIVYPTWQLHGVSQFREKGSATKETARLTLNTFIKHPALETPARIPVGEIEGLESVQPPIARTPWP